jgi:hypothetical protein
MGFAQFMRTETTKLRFARATLCEVTNVMLFLINGVALYLGAIELFAN